MVWDPDSSEVQLLQAIDALDRPLVNALCDALIEYVRVAPEPYRLQPAKGMLDALRGVREFALLQRVAVELIQAGLGDPAIRRYHAQALLDQGDVLAAEAVLKALVEQTEPGSDEHGEARGLLGRAYKQMYIAAENGPLERRRALLELAIAKYRGGYLAHGKHWHGINAVALLERAHRDGLTLDSEPDPRAEAGRLAEEILAVIGGLAETDKWARGTAVEASVAVGRRRDIVWWFSQFLRAADSFALASILRQLTEVWALEPGTEPGSLLIPLLQAELLRRDGGPDIRVAPGQVGPDTAAARVAADDSYQKVLGDERMRNLRWLLVGLERCASVARVEDPLKGGIGTAFLVAGKPLADWLPEVVFVTNAHVVSDTKGVKPEKAVVTFRMPDLVVSRHKVTLLWSSPPDGLDVSILGVVGDQPGGPRCPVADSRPSMDSEPLPRTYIIGHAGGGEDIMLSLSDNKMLDFDDKYVQYRTPTLGGSSGSPVFNEEWELIALHHRGHAKMPRLDGLGTHPANQGVWWDAIAAALKAAPDPRTAPRASGDPAAGTAGP